MPRTEVICFRQFLKYPKRRNKAGQSASKALKLCSMTAREPLPCFRLAVSTIPSIKNFLHLRPKFLIDGIVDTAKRKHGSGSLAVIEQSLSALDADCPALLRRFGYFKNCRKQITSVLGIATRHNAGKANFLFDQTGSFNPQIYNRISVPDFIKFQIIRTKNQFPGNSIDILVLGI